MPRRGPKPPYKPKVEYKYTVNDIVELAGMTRNALGVAKVHGKIGPGDFKSVISFLTRRIIDNRLTGNLLTPPSADGKENEEKQEQSPCLGEEAQKESSPQIETPS
jgi:hypothetical protein